MASANEAVLTIRLLDNVSDVSDKIAKKFGVDVDSMHKASERMGTWLKGGFVAATAAAAAGAAAVAAGIYATMKAASDAQQPLAQLANTMQTKGIASPENMAAVDAYIRKMDQLTTYSRGDYAAAFYQVFENTTNVTEAMRAVGIAADVAAKKQIPLTQAAGFLSKALAGNVESLGEIIPAIRAEITALGEGATAAEKKATALRVLTDMFEGSAKTAAETFAGRLARMGNAFTDLKVSIGNAILASPAWTKAMDAVWKAVAIVDQWARDNAATITGTFTAAWNGAVALIPVVAQGFGTLIGSLMDMRINFLYTAEASHRLRAALAWGSGARYEALKKEADAIGKTADAAVLSRDKIMQQYGDLVEGSVVLSDALRINLKEKGFDPVAKSAGGAKRAVDDMRDFGLPGLITKAGEVAAAYAKIIVPALPGAGQPGAVGPIRTPQAPINKIVGDDGKILYENMRGVESTITRMQTPTGAWVAQNEAAAESARLIESRYGITRDTTGKIVSAAGGWESSSKTIGTQADAMPGKYDLITDAIGTTVDGMTPLDAAMLGISTKTDAIKTTFSTGLPADLDLLSKHPLFGNDGAFATMNGKIIEASGSISAMPGKLDAIAKAMPAVELAADGRLAKENAILQAMKDQEAALERMGRKRTGGGAEPALSPI